MTTEVSSTILDLIIVLFRGNEEEGGKKIHPMSEAQIIGDARWN